MNRVVLNAAEDVFVLAGGFEVDVVRARRNVTAVDAGSRRDCFVDQCVGAAHGFISRDGTPPAVIAVEARRQLLRYPAVRWLEGVAEEAEPWGAVYFPRRSTQH